ncbi:hypothetical protein TNIN_81951 [Trichonephila inaurata madagascariensis]|uniref:Secreted protein n=1 Tax=Trichonephila inaurata madagascariensis TaxID=2747483 RepID=A0A8X6YD46_9ARAC|nr:hypothetical protein TNIN_81951 [Trichonephila inaurata madagascariensis]
MYRITWWYLTFLLVPHMPYRGVSEEQAHVGRHSTSLRLGIILDEVFRQSFGVKGSTREKGAWFADSLPQMRLEMICGTIGSSTSDCIVERVTEVSMSASYTILRSSCFVVILVAPDPVLSSWVPSLVHCSQHVRHDVHKFRYRIARRDIEQVWSFVLSFSSTGEHLVSAKGSLSLDENQHFEARSLIQETTYLKESNCSSSESRN